ncbi:hypothetical protein [Canibacter oris]|uniref:ABC transporter permease n=1 Tax=Canibacter oris TaxID=1365628 RepID=A0A840DMP5_9MICO|nr:hypothetical protein [Canibacter oris]MBB4071328.1 hypothetical protein [Canibacter oris]
MRSIPEIATVAPVGYLGSQIGTEKWLGIIIPWEVLQPAQRIGLTFEIASKSHDGVSWRLDYATDVLVEIDLANWDGVLGETAVPQSASEHGIVVSYPGSTIKYSDSAITPQGLYVALYPVLLSHTSIVAVDPEAEMDLLGEAASFLQPLQQAEKLITDLEGLNATKIASLIPAESDILPPEFLHYPGLRDFENAPAVWGFFGANSDLVPYLRYEDALAPQRMTISISQLQEQGAAALLEVGSTEVDLQKIARPFSVFKLQADWPGQETTDIPGLGYTVVNKYDAVSISGLELQQYTKDDEKTAFRVIPHGFNAGVFELPNYSPTGRIPGETTKYRETTPRELQIGTPQKNGAAPFEAGVFDREALKKLALQAPLGLYDGAAITLENGAVLETNRLGTGLGVSAPHVIVSLDSAKKFTPDDYVTAVRIKVAGLDNLTREAAQLQIDLVANQIRSLGFGAMVVSGSSTQSIDIYVPDYAFGVTDPLQNQTVADLGWVTQNFTVTGSDNWTSSTISEVAYWVSNSLFVILLLGLSIVIVSVRPQRLRQQSLLRSLGWSFGRRLRWGLSEVFPGVVVIAAGIVASICLATAAQQGAVIALSCLIILLVLGSVPMKPAVLTPAANVLCSRRKIFFLLVLETAVCAVAAVIAAILAQLARWLWSVGATMSLSNAVLQALLPVAFLASGVLCLMLGLQLFSNQNLRQILFLRVRFFYMYLGQSVRSIMLRLLVVASVQMIAASVAIAALLLALKHWYQPDATSLVTLAVCWFAWVLMLINRISQLKPQQLEQY